ncbi:hypothetical protein [Roseibium marinum]|uniref:Uncharacterized protein n=1 Tax=Roseibium marinum TaxID=281252 RepID=A0A2S3UVA8_9HYPH|nr:hypothetical protein [Roseibium marinum]POF31662.1 hypothetical protein CLV41_104231 [Roseibium marinum]
MSDRHQSATIRNPLRISAAFGLGLGGCLLGAGLALGGFALAERQQSLLDARLTATSQERDLLVGALKDAWLTGPRLRLEELAALPLIPEYLSIAENRPDSVDAKELEDYLRTVLEAAGRETGLQRIALVSANGSELLAAENPAAASPDAKAVQVEAVVYDFDDPQTPAGRLTGALADSSLTILPPDSATGTDTTASTAGGPARPGSLDANSFGVADLTRLLAALAGIATALFGLTGAALLRTRQAQR